jgi:hypothetical protein
VSRWKSSSAKAVLERGQNAVQVPSEERGRTVDEKEMGAGILLSPTGEIADDTVDVGGGGHEDVHRVEAWLCLAVARYGFDDWCAGCSGRSDKDENDQGAHGLHSPLKYQTALEPS